jgi:hypothetical protein
VAETAVLGLTEADRQVLDGWPGRRGVAKAAVLRLTGRC